jgi:hypothetical protein
MDPFPQSSLTMGADGSAFMKIAVTLSFSKPRFSFILTIHYVTVFSDVTLCLHVVSRVASLNSDPSTERVRLYLLSSGEGG